MKYINFHVGKVHNSLNMLPNDVRVVRKGSTKIRLFTGTHILQEKRARFSQHAVDGTCNLCLANAKLPVTYLHIIILEGHFL